MPEEDQPPAKTPAIPKYHNPREVVRDAVIDVLDASFKKNGQNVPRDMVEDRADQVLDEYERLIRGGSWWRMLRDGLVVNLVWWALTGALGLLVYFYYCNGKAVTIHIGQ